MENEIFEIRREYRIQKKLENIVTKRKLNRPNIKKWQVATSVAFLPFLIFGVVICTKFIENDLYRALGLIFGVVMVAEIQLRISLILIIKYYQRTAKEETRRCCKCIPSCSEYSILCLKKIFPLLIALLKIRKRLFVTCDGKEYKVDFPTKRESKKFESLL